MADLFFDLETIPDYDREPLFELPELVEIPEPVAAADLIPIDEVMAMPIKDIEAYLLRSTPEPQYLLDILNANELGLGGKTRAGVSTAVTKFNTHLEKIQASHEKRRLDMSVIPEYCRIAALGWRWSDEESAYSMVAREEEYTESDLIDKFWELASICLDKKQGRIGGYNILHFDLPVIFMRSILLDIFPTTQINLSGYGNSHVVDVFKGRFKMMPTGSQPAKLKDIARLLGIPVEAEGVDGSDVMRLLKENPAMLHKYVQSDVNIVMEVDKKFRGVFYH